MSVSIRSVAATLLASAAIVQGQSQSLRALPGSFDPNPQALRPLPGAAAAQTVAAPAAVAAPARAGETNAFSVATVAPQAAAARPAVNNLAVTGAPTAAAAGGLRQLPGSFNANPGALQPLPALATGGARPAAAAAPPAALRPLPGVASAAAPPAALRPLPAAAPAPAPVAAAPVPPAAVTPFTGPQVATVANPNIGTFSVIQASDITPAAAAAPTPAAAAPSAVAAVPTIAAAPFQNNTAIGAAPVGAGAVGGVAGVIPLGTAGAVGAATVANVNTIGGLATLRPLPGAAAPTPAAAPVPGPGAAGPAIQGGAIAPLQPLASPPSGQATVLSFAGSAPLATPGVAGGNGVLGGNGVGAQGQGGAFGTIAASPTGAFGDPLATNGFSAGQQQLPGGGVLPIAASSAAGLGAVGSGVVAVIAAVAGAMLLL